MVVWHYFLLILLIAQFGLGSCKYGSLSTTARQHGGTFKTKSTRSSAKPPLSACSKKTAQFHSHLTSGWEDASNSHFSGASSAYILGRNDHGNGRNVQLVGNLGMREAGVLVETLEWN